MTTEFYKRATADIIIGFHFRNIKDFDKHIPRIAAFWEIQIMGKTQKKVDPPFDLINLHSMLGIKVGQLNRWVTIFNEVLEDFRNQDGHHIGEYLIWKEKIEIFRRKFLTNPQLFSDKGQSH